MRILIATVTAGGGHLAAAAALEEAWSRLRPDDTLEKVDVLRFFAPLHRKVYAEGYVTIAQRAPELWGLMFKKTDNPTLARRLNQLRRIFPTQSGLRFTRFINQFKPDAALCTHHLPVEIIGTLRGPGIGAATAEPAARAGKGRGASPPTTEKTVPPRPLVASVVTDFEAHALWMNPCVDLYCVAAEESRARLIARGARPEAVLATGIPISAKFSLKVDPSAVRRRYGLRDDLPVVLVLSGGFGMGPVAGAVRELDKTERVLQTVVVAGHNEDLRRELASQERKHPTHILGFVSNMHELMAAADLIVSKPGGLTSSEALAMGKPLLIVDPIPGQEAANSDFLLEHGAAAKANRVEDLPFRLEQLLDSRKLAEMAKAARTLGRPQAARAICEAVVRSAAEQGIAHHR